MKSLQLKIATWLLKRLEYKFVAVKAANGSIDIKGDKELLGYVDTSGFFFNREPLKRNYPEFVESKPIKPLAANILAEIEVSTEPFPEELKKQNETID